MLGVHLLEGRSVSGPHESTELSAERGRIQGAHRRAVSEC
jgi:hypothetical protein